MSLHAVASFPSLSGLGMSIYTCWYLFSSPCFKMWNYRGGSLGSPEVPEVWVPVCRACQVLPSDIPRL